MSIQFNLHVNDPILQARTELINAGYKELRTPDDVDDVFAQKGTTLIMINSSCGCTGGIARPAAEHSLHYDRRPDHLVTVFPGQDGNATERLQTYFENFRLTSPSFVLIKDGEFCKVIPRHRIEGTNPVIVMGMLQEAFDKYCDEV